MTRPSNPNPHLAFRARMVGKACRHPLATNQRLFDESFSAARVGQLEADPNWQGCGFGRANVRSATRLRPQVSGADAHACARLGRGGETATGPGQRSPAAAV